MPWPDNASRCMPAGPYAGRTWPCIGWRLLAVRALAYAQMAVMGVGHLVGAEDSPAVDRD